MKFSLAKAVPGGAAKQDNKRQAAESQDAPRRSKVLKASDIVIETGPKPPAQMTRKFAANAPVNLVIFKVSDAAGDVWERFKGSDEPLWQLQLSQDSARPLTYQFRDRFSDYLRSTKDVPDTLQELQDECGIRLVVGDKNDPDDVGFVQWRPALYAVGDLSNARSPVLSFPPT